MNINKKVMDIFKNIHKDTYDYSLVDYINNTTKVKIICKEHGIFEQTPQHHKRGSGCPKCGLRKIGVNRKLSNQQFIDSANNTHNNKYDYSLTSIEFNGIQHYQPIDAFGGSEGFLDVKKRDNIKYNFCKSNNIKLIIISYKEIGDVDYILTENLL